MFLRARRLGSRSRLEKKKVAGAGKKLAGSSPLKEKKSIKKLYSILGKMESFYD